MLGVDGQYPSTFLSYRGGFQGCNGSSIWPRLWDHPLDHFQPSICPVFGHYLPRLSLRAVFGFGLVGTSSCACTFGLLPFLPTTAAFLGASYSLRIAEGIAEAAAWFSALTLMANVFGKRSPLVFSLSQVKKILASEQ